MLCLASFVCVGTCRRERSSLPPRTVSIVSMLRRGPDGARDSPRSEFRPIVLPTAPLPAPTTTIPPHTSGGREAVEGPWCKPHVVAGDGIPTPHLSPHGRPQARAPTTRAWGPPQRPTWTAAYRRRRLGRSRTRTTTRRPAIVEVPLFTVPLTSPPKNRSRIETDGPSSSSSLSPRLDRNDTNERTIEAASAVGRPAAAPADGAAIATTDKPVPIGRYCV
jgi:hypothetical protein